MRSWICEDLMYLWCIVLNDVLISYMVDVVVLMISGVQLYSLQDVVRDWWGFVWVQSVVNSGDM